MAWDAYTSLFAKIASKKALSNPLNQLIENDFIEESSLGSDPKIGASFRASHLSRELAKRLIDEKGELHKETVTQASHLLQSHLYLLGPHRENDSLHREHLLKRLKDLLHDPKLQLALKKIHAPHRNPKADALIRKTLLLDENVPLTDALTRQAALSSLFMRLRQNVGSCFATSLAILIHEENPSQFLSDLSQLLGQGSLKRVRDGVEFQVPLNPSSGAGDFYRPLFVGENPMELFSSHPSFIIAFKAAGLGKFAFLKTDFKIDSFTFVPPSILIRNVLLHFFNLNENDVSIETQTEGRVSSFLRAYERAKEAYSILNENPLLRAWEYTLASLSEAKGDFSSWNLFISLGLDPAQVKGVGHSIYEVLDRIVKQIHSKIEEFQKEIEPLDIEAAHFQNMVNQSTSSAERHTFQNYLQMKSLQIHRLIYEREELIEKAKRLANLMPLLIRFYEKKCLEYFQEVYDPEIQGTSQNPYDDRPAGFRLLYKHGRTLTSLWSLIKSSSEFIQALNDFFLATEIELHHLPEFDGLQKEISEIVSEVVLYLKTDEFLYSSFVRLATSYNEPPPSFENMLETARKPWQYISGGTMSTLVTYYFGLVNPPKEKKLWVESGEELLAFYLDHMKDLSSKEKFAWTKESNKSMLAFSPTHAFLLRPGWDFFRQGWEHPFYSYSWIRDHLTDPCLRFLSDIYLDRRKSEYLIDKLKTLLPRSSQATLSKNVGIVPFNMNPRQWREMVVEALEREWWMRDTRNREFLFSQIDHLLFSSLPLFTDGELKTRLEVLFKSVEEIDDSLRLKILQGMEEPQRYQIFSSQDLLWIAKTLVMKALEKTSDGIDFHRKLWNAMQKCGFAYPRPLFCADSNWPQTIFGFTVNPGTSVLELWRFDEGENVGYPMVEWKRYFQGMAQEPWGLYVSSIEYN